MIFNNNTTTLGTIDIPMAEGYDGSVGCALALVESARNDLAMFDAMLKVEAQALNMGNAGYTNESVEVISLQEAAVSGIWNKIKELFSKLASKVKAIFHTFMSKLNSLFMNDKQMVKKYSKELYRKTNLGNMTVKWADINKDPDADAPEKASFDFAAMSGKLNKYDKDQDATERVEAYLKTIVSNTDKDSFAEDFHDMYFDDVETKELKECEGINGIRDVLSYLEGSAKILKNLDSASRKVTSNLQKLVSEADKEAGKIAKAANDVDKNDPNAVKKSDDEIAKANGVFEEAKAYQTAMLMNLSCIQEAIKFKYRQMKAVFMKAIAANDKKLEESAVLLDAIEEAAAEEVTEVIDSALSSEDISKTISAASKDVKGGDVTNDADALVYGIDDPYTQKKGQHLEDAPASKVSEAFFSAPLY